MHHGRAEELLARAKFQSLLVRAVAPLVKLLTWFAPFWGSFERLLVIKGPAWVDERHAAREGGALNGLQLRKLGVLALARHTLGECAARGAAARDANYVAGMKRGARLSVGRRKSMARVSRGHWSSSIRI